MSSITDEGWFVALDDHQHGPISASDAWHLVTGKGAKPPIHVWHPLLVEWRALPIPEAAAEPSGPMLQLRDFRLSNARFITWIACTVSPVFVVGAAIARDFQDLSLNLIVIAIVGFFGWWLYLEQSGLQFRENELVFPTRIPIWPYPAMRLSRLRIAEISRFECWSQGGLVHWFRIHGAGTSRRILLDDSLHREILVLALERRLPKATPT